MSQDINKFKKKAIIAAFAASVFYAVNAPFSKLLLNHIGPKMLAAFLYLGAGIGVMAMSMFRKKKPERSQRLSMGDLPYTVGMIILDIAAPIFLMVGLSMTTAANASLLNNFEIVATTVIAWIVFRENVSIRLWIAVALTPLQAHCSALKG